jgi:hypothetical protein
MTEHDQSPQSDDTTLRASVDADGGCCWEICGGGVCLQGRDRAELLRRWNQRPASCHTET